MDGWCGNEHGLCGSGLCAIVLLWHMLEMGRHGSMEKKWVVLFVLAIWKKKVVIHVISGFLVYFTLPTPSACESQ